VRVFRHFSLCYLRFLCGSPQREQRKQRNETYWGEPGQCACVLTFESLLSPFPAWFTTEGTEETRNETYWGEPGQCACVLTFESLLSPFPAWFTTEETEETRNETYWEEPGQCACSDISVSVISVPSVVRKTKQAQQQGGTHAIR
jgi:hypothetical protein